MAPQSKAEPELELTSPRDGNTKHVGWHRRFSDPTTDTLMLLDAAALRAARKQPADERPMSALPGLMEHGVYALSSAIHVFLILVFRRRSRGVDPCEDRFEDLTANVGQYDDLFLPAGRVNDHCPVPAHPGRRVAHFPLDPTSTTTSTRGSALRIDYRPFHPATSVAAAFERAGSGR